ncbi:hypothetical protein CkaCkLH20_04602 [Colletotrichum karsti]|uniref:Uncharacterized protein n=1 Tax=Colletotrichum karsti TaxID=1095194 RepID=A0A9P6LMA8_9PEZI|nr:uncharacterized protein CkaCkLH20_04602 [Colletotrichum karsti]KAF9878026.1 hypothetical protein CkaCkLH20_04602 [Colletotrichum karsti]
MRRKNAIMELAAAALGNEILPTSRSHSDEPIELTDMSHAARSANADMKAIWKAVEAPHTTFSLDNSKFYLPEGPLANDSFWLVIAKGEKATVDRHGPHLVDCEEPKVKINNEQRPFIFTCGSLIVDFHFGPSWYLFAQGELAEECVIRRLHGIARTAADSLAKSMGGLLWHRIQRCGGVYCLVPMDVARSLGRTAEILLEFTELAGRLVETMRRRRVDDGVPAAFRKVLQLLGIVEWYRVHRAFNAVQVLQKAYEGLRSPTAQKRMASTGCIEHAMLGMLGWRLAPESIGEQQGALSEGLHSLYVLSNTDWTGFDAAEVEGRVRQKTTPVCVVKDNWFCAWAFGTVCRFLTHQTLECVCSAEELASCPGPSRFEGHLRFAHLEMFKTLPWVESFTGTEHTRLRFHPEAKLLPGFYEGHPEGPRDREVAKASGKRCAR